MDTSIGKKYLRCLAFAACIAVLPAKSTLAAEPIFDGWKTLGGPVHWTDYVIHGGWRIQQHMHLGYYRLLDPSDRRMARGSFDECYQELQRRRLIGEIPPMGPHVVLVMHGLAGTRGWMAPLADYLHERGGYTVLNMGYASTQGTLQEQTLALESVVRNLQGVQEVSFVCHSMSNIMVRHLFYRFQQSGRPPTVAFRRMVMISPPNHGAQLADAGVRAALGRVFLGEVVNQLASSKGWPRLERQLCIPAMEFGIIAGGTCDDFGYLCQIPGDDDAILSIQTHVLPGASDFLQVGGRHQFMPRLEATKRATLRFLDHGTF